MFGNGNGSIGAVNVEVGLAFEKMEKEIRSDLPRKMKEAGEAGGDAVLKGLRERFKRDVGQAKEDLARGLIDRESFERRGQQAARSFNDALLKEIQKRRAAGNLTEQDASRLQNALKKQGTQGARSFRAPFEEMVGWLKGGFLVAATAAVAIVARRVIDAARRVGRAIREFLEEAGNFQQGRDAFQRSALSAGLDPDRVLDELRQGLRGTVRDAELFVLAQQAIQNELPVTEESMGRLATVARRLAEAQGRDVPDALRRMIRGISKVEPELLDELGIITRLETALREWEKQTGRNSDALTQAEKTVIFFNAVLEEGERKVRNLGAESFSARRPIDQLAAAVANFRSRVAEAIVESPHLVRLLTSIGGAAEDSADRVERAALAIGAAVDALITEIGDKALVKGLIQFLELAAPFLETSGKVALPGLEDTFERLLAEREAILELEQQSRDRIRETQQETDVATLITEVARVRAEIDFLNAKIDESEALRAEVSGEELENLNRLIRLDRVRLRLRQDEEAAALGRLDRVTAEGRSEPVDPEELVRRMQAEARLRLAEIERDVAAEIRDLDRQLEEAALSFEEFYDRLEEQAVRPIDEQRRLLERQRGLATTDSARTAIDAQLVELEGQRAEIVARFAQERIAAEEEYRDQVLEIEREILEATGRGAEARAREIDARFDAILARARAEADQEAIAQIERARTLAQTRLRFDTVLEATRRARAELEQEIEAADLALEAGTISREEHFERVKLAIEGTRGEIRDMLPDLERMARILGDPELLEVIRELRLEMERLKNETKETASVFEEKAFQAGTSALAEFFTTGIQQAESFGDAMRRLALSVVQSIQRIIAQMLAAQIIKGIFNLFGANVPSGIGGFGGGGLVGSRGTGASGLGQGTLGRGVASGGLIRGPGGPRDDEIPAFLSNGEFVIQAEAVDRFGPAFFDRLNRMDPVAAAQPSPTFVQMAGGQSSAPSIQQTSELLNGRLEVGVDEGLILKQLQSNEGQRILLKTISKHRSGVRRALGLG